MHAMQSFTPDTLAELRKWRSVSELPLIRKYAPKYAPLAAPLALPPAHRLGPYSPTPWSVGTCHGSNHSICCQSSL